MIDISNQELLAIGAGILFVAFLFVRGQRGLYDLLMDREGASKELLRK